MDICKYLRISINIRRRRSGHLGSAGVDDAAFQSLSGAEHFGNCHGLNKIWVEMTLVRLIPRIPLYPPSNQLIGQLCDDPYRINLLGLAIGLAWRFAIFLPLGIMLAMALCLPYLYVRPFRSCPWFSFPAPLTTISLKILPPCCGSPVLGAIVDSYRCYVGVDDAPAVPGGSARTVRFGSVVEDQVIACLQSAP